MSVKKRTVTKKRRRRTAAANPPRQTRRRARRRSTALMTAPARGRKRARHRRNPVLAKPKNRRRHYRKNPAKAYLATPSIKRPMSLVAPIAIGLGGAVVTDQVPIMLGLSGYSAKAAQAGSVIGGGMLINGIFGPVGMAAWIVGGGIIMLKDLVTGMLFPATDIISQPVSGLGNVPGYPVPGYPVDGYEGLGAFPDAYSGYPDMMY